MATSLPDTKLIQYHVYNICYQGNATLSANCSTLLHGKKDAQQCGKKCRQKNSDPDMVRQQTEYATGIERIMKTNNTQN